MSQPLEIQSELVCDACGQAGAYALGDGAWCVACYAEVSSSCAGGGKSEETRELAPPISPVERLAQ